MLWIFVVVVVISSGKKRKERWKKGEAEGGELNGELRYVV